VSESTDSWVVRARAQNAASATSTTSTEQHIANLAQLVHGLGTQVPALDAVLDREQSGLLAQEIEAARAHLERAARLLERSVRLRATKQQAALVKRGKGKPLKLNLASGERQLPDFVNLDANSGSYRHCLQWRIPLPARSVSHVFFAHGLEHLYFESEALPVLRDIKRVLTAGGTLRLIVPDIGALCEAYAAKDAELFAARRETWLWESGCYTALEQTLSYAGAGPAPHAFFCHKFGYDFETLALLLERAGFKNIVRCSFMGSKHAALRVDDQSEVGALSFRGQSCSLFVEASR